MFCFKKQHNKKISELTSCYNYLLAKINKLENLDQKIKVLNDKIEKERNEAIACDNLILVKIKGLQIEINKLKKQLKN